MNLTQILNESVGLTNRKLGDVFVNADTGEEIVFQDIRFFPESGAYEDPRDLVAQIEWLEGKIGQNIQWVNSSRSVGAFAVAYFESAAGPMYFGRYFAKVHPYIKQNFWPNSDLMGFALKRAASAKTRSGYYPSDLLTNTMGQTPESILAQISEKFDSEHPLYKVTAHLVEGDRDSLPYTFESGDVEFTAFRDVYAEILQPIAIMRGVYTGNAAEAERLFLGGARYEDCVINFNTSKTAGLYDSVLEAPNGSVVRISSKGGMGASASSGNLVRSVEEINASGDKRLLSRFKEEIEILRTIDDENYIMGPLKLGVKYGIITEREAQTIVTYLQGPKTKAGLTNNLKQLILHRSQTARDPGKISQGYTLLAAVAYRVAEYVNTSTRFGEAATTILNNGALIQCYTQANAANKNITLSNFSTVFPSRVASGVSLSSDKTYYNTGNKGKFTFVISAL
jgi:hypothetical protein